MTQRSRLVASLPFRPSAARLFRVTLRRFAAIALAASLLHLNVVRADAACAHHEQGPAAAQQDDRPVLPHHDMAEMPASPSDDHTDHESRCDAPAQADCCQVLASCALAFDASTEVTQSSASPSHENIVGAAIEIPLSRVTTPDPPPPRA